MQATPDDDTHTEAEHALPPIMLALSSARPIRILFETSVLPKLTPAIIEVVDPDAGLFVLKIDETAGMSYVNIVEIDPLWFEAVKIILK